MLSWMFGLAALWMLLDDGGSDDEGSDEGGDDEGTEGEGDEGSDDDDDDSDDDKDDDDDDDESPKTRLTAKERRKYKTEMAKHNKMAAAYRIALKEDRHPIEERESEAEARIKAVEEREQRSAVRSLLVDNNIPKEAYELVAPHAEFDRDQEVTNGESLIKMAKSRIKALTKSVDTKPSKGKVGSQSGSGEESDAKSSWFKKADNFV